MPKYRVLLAVIEQRKSGKRIVRSKLTIRLFSTLRAANAYMESVWKGEKGG